MLHEYRRRRNDDLEGSPAKRRDDLYVKLSDRIPMIGGSEFSVNGRNVFFGLLAAAFFFLAIVQSWRSDIQHQDIINSTNNLAKVVAINTYVLTLSDEKRQALDLAEPKEITELRQLREWQRRFSREIIK